MAAPSLQALLVARGITDYRQLATRLAWSKQQAHVYWHGYRRVRDPATGASVVIPVRPGRQVALLLSRTLQIPLEDLLLASDSPPAAPVSSP